MYERDEISKDLRISEGSMNNELQAQPNLYFKYAQAAREAELLELQAKASLEQCVNTLGRQIKASTTERVTEKEIERRVSGTSEYVELKNAHITAKYNAGVLGSAEKAFAQRKDVLVALCYSYKHQGELAV